jgi:hypothetical protein
MLVNGSLTFEGEVKQIPSIKKRHLWTYLYYLWTHNRNIDEFKEMPTPENMKSLVSPKAIYVSKDTIATVINNIVKRNRDEIDISVISQLLKELQRKLVQEDEQLVNAMSSIKELEGKIEDLRSRIPYVPDLSQPTLSS